LYLQMVGLMHLSSPGDEMGASHTLVRLVSNEQAMVLNAAINFDIIFNDQTSQLIAKYQDRKAFLTLLTLDANKQVINYSNTFFNS